MEYVPPSPASSNTSLPVDEDDIVSEFSDTDFDIISSDSGSHLGHDDERNQDTDFADAGEHDVFTGGDEEAARLVAVEWAGAGEDVATRDLRLPTPEEERRENRLQASNDALVMSALSESIARPSSVIERPSLTPSIGGSTASLHFTTFPRATSLRSSSATLPRAHIDSSLTLSDSTSTLQLSYPDPLPRAPPSPVHEAHLKEAPASSEPLSDHDEEHDSPTSSAASSFVITSTALPAPVMDEAGHVLDTMADTTSDEDSDDEEDYDQPAITLLPPPPSITPAVAPSSRAVINGASSQYIRFISDLLLGTNHRWTASVVVSILAILIGSATYMGGSISSVTLKAANLTTTNMPSPTLWGSLNSSIANKTVAPQPLSAPNTQPTMFRDKSLSLFTPWAVAELPTARVEGDRLMPRRLKRKRSGSSTVDCSSSKPPCHRSRVETISYSVRPLIEAGPSISASVDEVLITPVKEAFSDITTTLSSDLSQLLSAMDDFLDVVRTQTQMSLELLSPKRVVDEATSRHRRAKSNARKIRKQGVSRVENARGVMIDGFKRAAEIVNTEGAKERATAIKEGMIDGFRKKVRTRNLKAPYEGRKASKGEGRKVRGHRARTAHLWP